MSDLIKHYRQLVGIAKGWAVKSLAGWSEETHRDLLTRHGITGELDFMSIDIDSTDTSVTVTRTRSHVAPAKLFDLMSIEDRLGIVLTAGFEMDPEHSSLTVFVRHPQAEFM